MIKLVFQSEISTQWVIHSSVGLRKKNTCHKNKGMGARWASEKGARDRFPPKISGSSDRSASLCHISLRRSSQRLAGNVWPGLTAGGAPVQGQTTRPSSLLSQQSGPMLPYILLDFLAGGKSGSRWGVGLPTPKPPEKWGGDPDWL